MKSLLLTLGHNSSAVLVEDGQVVCGYENERITGVKSDSRFPIHAIDYMVKRGYLPGGKVDMVYACHWAPDGQLTSMSSKHWDPAFFDGTPVRSMSPDFTHHDAHMAGAMAYASPGFPRTASYGFVIDGFGNFGEHLSVYELWHPQPKLVKRVHGYDTSLGLWYQYATAFLGMKMHEDEYKLLGYEAHIDPELANQMQAEAEHTAELWLDAMHRGAKVFGSRYDPLYAIDALQRTKDKTFSHLADVARRFHIEDPTSFEGRVKMAFYVQAVLEEVVLAVISEYQPINVVLSGGVFHNVKLNKMVMDSIDGKICVMPLCGDQGNGIGMYAFDHPDFVFPKDLYWGQRDLKRVGSVPGLLYVDADDAIDIVHRHLQKRGYVNVVKGAMEFGPRALCNTSTIALPHPAIVERINDANDRNTVMPMAPVMNRQTWKSRFKNPSKVHRSEEHMILAMEYNGQPADNEMGVAHPYNWPYQYQTGRPQVLEGDRLMDPLLAEHGMLINTSFNYHGLPIALDMEHVVKNHNLQYQRDSSFHTVVIV